MAQAGSISVNPVNSQRNPWASFLSPYHSPLVWDGLLGTNESSTTPLRSVPRCRSRRLQSNRRLSMIRAKLCCDIPLGLGFAMLYVTTTNENIDAMIRETRMAGKSFQLSAFLRYILLSVIQAKKN